MINFKEKSFKGLFYLGLRHLIDCPKTQTIIALNKNIALSYKKKKGQRHIAYSF